MIALTLSLLFVYPPPVVLHYRPPVAVVVAEVPALDRERLLEVILMIEGHEWTDPGGALAFTRATWSNLTRLPYRYAQRRDYAFAVGRKLLAEFERHAKAEGLELSVTLAAGAWNMGIRDAIRREKLGWPRGYALRTAALYADPLLVVD